MTILANKIAAGQAESPAAAAARRAREVDVVATKLAPYAGSPRGEIVDLPVLGPAWIQLASSDVLTEITGSVMARMADLKLEAIPLNGDDYAAERTKRILAWAVRDADNRLLPFGTLAEWGTIDSDLMMACGMKYNDVRVRLDPVSSASLTENDFAVIMMAIEKKDPALLLSCGLAKLSLYLLTTASPPASSPTPPSSSGES
jgi:hypothetical protein